MFSTYNGKVEAISKDRHGIKIDGHDWVNNKFQAVPATINRGDIVNVAVKDNKFWNKISTGPGVSGGAEAPTAAPTPSTKLDLPVYVDRDRAIIRQNSLTNAVNFYSSSKQAGHTDEDVAKIIDIARQFEAYSSGQIDFYNMQKMIKDIEDGVDEAS